MILAKQCIVCGSDAIRTYPAKLAPFISEYVFDGKETNCNFCQCTRCQLFFSDARFDDAEIERLYKNYRGERYCAVRERFEPGYRKINEEIGRNNMEIKNRKWFSTEIIAQHPKHGAWRSVLDFGGDRGQLIPDEFSHAKRYVYELSGTQPMEGIEALRLPELAAPYDVVMCRGVLEHVSFPVSLLKQLRSLLAPNGVLYLEMPEGIPARMYFEATLAPSRIGRNKKLTIHEHINYFTKCALKNALLVSGLRPIVVKIAYLECGWTKFPLIGCLAIAGDPVSRPNYGRFDLFLEGIEYAVKRHIFPVLAPTV